MLRTERDIKTTGMIMSSPFLPSAHFPICFLTSKIFSMAAPNKKQKVQSNIGDVSVVLIQHWAQQVDDLRNRLTRAERAAADAQHRLSLSIDRYHQLARDHNESIFHNQVYQRTLIQLRHHFQNCMDWIRDDTEHDEIWAGYNRIIENYNMVMQIDLTADTESESSEEEN